MPDEYTRAADKLNAEYPGLTWAVKEFDHGASIGVCGSRVSDHSDVRRATKVVRDGRSIQVCAEEAAAGVRDWFKAYDGGQ